MIKGEKFRKECNGLFHGGDKYEEIVPCAFCESYLCRKEFGDEEVAIDFSKPKPVYYHRDCCPCVTEQSLLEDKWETLQVSFRWFPDDADYHSANEYVGTLARCPFCARVYDDDGKVVVL